MIAKRLLRNVVLIVCLFAAPVVFGQSWTTMLAMSPNPSPYLSDWSSRTETATLLVNNLNPTSGDVKILAEIEHNGKLVAYTNPDKVPVQTIPPGPRSFFGEAIVPMSAMHFEGNIDQSTQRSGRIPDGSICVHIRIVDAATLQQLAEDRKCVTILTFTPPYLNLPHDQAVLCKLGQNNVIEMNSGNPRPFFSWTPVVPAPSDPVLYHFSIFEVLPGQDPMTAFRSARSVFTRDLVGMTQLIWPVEYFYPEVGKLYSWSVRALDLQGRPLLSYQDGWATPFQFTVSEDCGEGGIDIDGDGIVDLDRLGEPITIGQKIEVHISSTEPQPLDPDDPHEFTARIRSATGGPFNLNWYMREVGTTHYAPIKKQPQTTKLYLAPGDTKPKRSYELKLVATKASEIGWDVFTFATGESSEGNGSSDSKTGEDGGARSETAISSTPGSRSYVSGRFAFVLDGSKNAGYLKSVDGGAVKADVVSDFNLEFGLGMSKPVYDWIQASWAKKYERRNGSIVAADYDYHEKARRDFHNALIEEIKMPALDGASKDPAYIKIKIMPTEVMSVKPDSNNRLTISDGGPKKWLVNNFRLQIDKLPCTKVNKIEAITFKQKVQEDHIGEMREPGHVEYPNITFTLPEADAKPWFDYFDAFKRAGKCTPDLQKGGVLVYLASDNTELFRLTFTDLCPRSITHVPPDVEGIKRVKIEIYCEDIRFDYASELGR